MANGEEGEGRHQCLTAGLREGRINQTYRLKSELDGNERVGGVGGDVNRVTVRVTVARGKSVVHIVPSLPQMLRCMCTVSSEVYPWAVCLAWG